MPLARCFSRPSEQSSQHPSQLPSQYAASFLKIKLPVTEIKTLSLFAITAVAEILGCYLPWLWLKQGASVWLLLPAALSLAAFVWLLTLHPSASGRIYAAYGGVYISVALIWLWLVDGVRPSGWDMAGVAVCLLGVGLIAFQPKV